MSHKEYKQEVKREVGPSEDTKEESHMQLASALLQIRSGGSPTNPTPPTRSNSTKARPTQPKRKERKETHDHANQSSTPRGQQQPTATSTRTPSVGGLALNQALLASAQFQLGSNLTRGPFVNQEALRSFLGMNSLPGSQSIASLQGQAASRPLPFPHASGTVSSHANSAIMFATPPPPSTPVGNAKTQETVVQPERRHSLVRKDQVEAALKSKPQRGRKREDLNELERIELTRTRNREHAKTTRIRKKARYQELLEEERQLQEFKQNENLGKARRAAVVRFVAQRREMLLANRHAQRSLPSSEATQAINTAPPSVDEFVQDITQFVFHVGNEDEGASAIERMVSFDDCLVVRVERRFGSAALALIRYDVRHGVNGVSLDRANGGTAEIAVTLSTDPPTPIQNGFLRVLFCGPESEKLSSVSWFCTRDYLERPLDRLNAQISHPSVVSLDPAVNNSENSATLRAQALANSVDRGIEDNQGGPGMSI